MKVFGYIRVSGLSQVDGDGPVRQAEKIVNFCGVNGLELSGNVSEDGVSGTVDGMDRPAFVHMLEHAKEFGADGIVVERLDRLARDLMVQEIILRELRERNLKLFCTDQPLQDVASNSGDPTRILFRQIMGALAQWEKSALVLKLKAGRDRVIAETGRCGGTVPYGKDINEQKVIAEIRGALEFGRTCREIANTLNALGKRTRTGREWTLDSVQRVAVSSKDVILPNDL